MHESSPEVGDIKSVANPAASIVKPNEESVLIVDDAEFIRELVKEQLAEKEIRVSQAASGEEAWDCLGRESFSLVISDIQLPNMDGLQLARRIRNQFPDIQIIIISGQRDIDYPIQALRAGADDYFTKPFSPEALMDGVMRCLEYRQMLIRGKYFEDLLRQKVYEATEELEKANEELTRTTEFLENILQNSPDAILIADQEGIITYVSESLEHMTLYNRDDLLGKKSSMLYVGGSLEERRMLRDLRRDKRIQNYETEMLRKDGEAFSISLSVSLLEDSDGGNLGMVNICKDITEQKKMEENLRELSIRDNLTNLYNQRYFYERLTKELERARRQNHPLCLILFDVDNFKYYNDTRGHLEGDVALQELGAIVVECIREGVDSGFRYGGDEFTLIISEATTEQAGRIAERIRTAFSDAGLERLSLSVGLVEYRDSLDIKDFIRMADQAMYEAKRSGGNQIHIVANS